MPARLLILLFALNSISVKVGDRAPDIDRSGVVRSPASTNYPLSLAGRYTVLQFLPNVTANAQAIDRWNELIATFADRPVQFVWIASEPRSAVEPFLKEHPMGGWLVIDEKKEAARAYGDPACDAIVDPSGKIMGFTSFLDTEQLSAILDGKGRLDSEPFEFRPPPIPVRPDFAPSYEVHISPSKSNGTDSSSGPDYWVQRGFDLKSMSSVVYAIDAGRVVLPAQLDNDDKFDFVMVLPKEEDEKTIHQLVRHAIEKYFKVSAAVESKPAEVYVVTSIKGRTPPAKTGNDSLGGGFASSTGFEFSLPDATPQTPEAMERAMRELLKHPETRGISNISAGNTTADDFCKLLEQGLGRPVINETGLEGVYDIAVHGSAANNEEFIRMLREQTGLVLTPATRSIEFLTLRSLN